MCRKVVQQCADVCNGTYTSTVRKASQLLCIALKETQSVIFLLLTHGGDSSSQLRSPQVVSPVENIAQGQLVKLGHLVLDILAIVAIVVVINKHLENILFY